MSIQLLPLESTLVGSGSFILDTAHLFLCSAFDSNTIAACRGLHSLRMHDDLTSVGRHPPELACCGYICLSQKQEQLVFYES